MPIWGFLLLYKRGLVCSWQIIRSPMKRILQVFVLQEEEKSYSKRYQQERWRYIFLDWINKSAKLKFCQERLAVLCWLPIALVSAEIMKPPNCTVLNMVGLLYQGQYDLSPGFNYHLLWMTYNFYLSALELNPWVQSCITKASCFLIKSQETYAWPDKEFFFSGSVNYSYEDLQSIQKFNHLYSAWI